MLLDTINKKNSTKQLLGKDKTGSLGNVDLKLDTAKSTVTLQTEKKSKKGQPLLSWEMNTKTGKIKQTSRSEDDDDVEVEEKDDMGPGSVDSDLDDADQDDGVDGPAALLQLETPSDTEMELADVERQKDVALKIMLFFVSFAMCSIAILYWLYKLSESQRQDEILKERIRRKGASSSPIFKKQSFMDFISSNLNHNSMLVSPYVPRNAHEQAKKIVDSEHAKVDHFDFSHNNFDNDRFPNIDEKGILDE